MNGPPFGADHPEIDCIFYANDDLALGGLFHCMTAGIKVPDRLALMGFNGTDIGKATPLPLSSIETPRFEIGQRAARHLLATDGDRNRVEDIGFRVFEGRTT